MTSHDERPRGAPDSWELNELRQLVAAIREGRVDGFVVHRDEGEVVYTLTGADRPYRLFLETMADGAATVSADGTVLFANSRLSNLLDTPLDELVGSDLRTFCTPDTSGLLRAVLVTSSHDQVRVVLRTGGGVLVPALVSGGHLDLDGQTVTCLVVADLSAEERALERLRFQARLLDAAGDAIIATDAAGTVTYANLAAEQLYGWSHDEMVGRPILELNVGPGDLDQATTIMAELAAGQTWSGEFTVHRKDGSSFPARVTDTPLTEPDGTVVGIIGISRDISARRRVEEQLEASERWFRTLVASSRDLIAVVDPDVRLVYASPSAQQVLGWDPDKRVGDSMLELVHPDDLATVAAAFAEDVQSPRRSAPLRWRCAAVDGGWRTLETVSTNCLDDPAIAGVVINARDVTDAERLQTELEDSERLLREAQRISHIGHWQWHVADARLEWLADEVFAIHGLTPRLWGGTLDHYLAMIPPEDRGAVSAAIQRALEVGAVEVEHRIVRPDGTVRHIRNRGIVVDDGQDVRLVGTCQDITDVVEARTALTERIKELTCLTRISTAAHQLDDHALLQAATVDALVEGMRFPAAATAFIDFDHHRSGVPPMPGQQMIEVPIRVGERRRGRLAVAYRDPELTFLAEERTLIASVADTLALWLERHDATSRLGLSETRYRHLADSASQGIYLLSLDGQIELDYYNAALSALLDVESSGSAEVLQTVQRLRTRGGLSSPDRTTGESATPPLELVSANGGRRWLELRETRIDPVASPGQASVQGIVLDVTTTEHERAALEEAVGREQEAVRRLQQVDDMKNAFLQAVSHELRTPLTTILGASTTLHERRGDIDEQQARQLLEAVVRNADRLRRLIEDLLDINRLTAGKIEPQREPVNLHGLIEDAVTDLGLDGRLTLRLDAPIIEADPRQLGRVLHNLLINVTRHTPPDSRVSVTSSEDDGGWVITVEDDGPGVPDELKSDIFDALQQGVDARSSAQPGTGIGLHLVARFAAMHGGTAWVTDRPGGGAAFHVRIGPPEVVGSPPVSQALPRAADPG